MEEIERMHMLNIEWGCITNLMNKIGDLEEAIDGGWPELVSMIADAVDEEDSRKAPESELFLNLFEYFWRLYYRLKANKEVREFNTVDKVTALGKETYRITNYDYHTYKWAKGGGFGSTISNDFIDMQADKLPDDIKRGLDKRRK